MSHDDHDDDDVTHLSRGSTSPSPVCSTVNEGPVTFHRPADQSSTFDESRHQRTPPRVPSSSSRPVVRRVTAPGISRQRVVSPSPPVASTSTSRREPSWTLFSQLMDPSLSSSPDVYESVLRQQKDSLESPTENIDGSGDRNEDVIPKVGGAGQTQDDGAPEFHASTATASVANYDSDYGDSDSDSLASDSEGHPSPPSKTSWPQIPTIPPLYRSVIKCSIAYFLASLFTFNPYLSRLIGDLSDDAPGTHVPSPSGHMVASIAVYYNPAKTVGGMIESDIFCIAGLLYASVICLVSMNLFWWFELSPGWEWIGDLAAIAWVGVGMSLLAWSKVYMAMPSYGTACSMMAIIVFVVVVKEGGLDVLLQVTTIVFYGSIISNIVCYTIWPQSAIQNLQLDMTKTLDSFSTVLNMLTSTFLLEGGFNSKVHREKVQKAVENHQSSFTSLKKSLNEARTEWIRRGDGDKILSGSAGKRAYQDAVDSLNRLGQHLNGLRSGTKLQYDLTRAGVVKSHSNSKGKRTRSVELDMEPAFNDDEETALLKAAAMMFGEIVDDLGPPLKALSSACTLSLRRLRVAFELSKSRQRRHQTLRPDEFIELVDGIERALVRFESTSNHAVLRFYRKHETSRPQSIVSVVSDKLESLPWNGNEQVFLVYFFIFTLQEFSREVICLIDAMRRIYEYEEEMMKRDPWWMRPFKKLWRKLTRRTPVEGRNRSPRPGLRRSFSAYLDARNRRKFPLFPKVQPHAPDTIQTPTRDKLPLIGRIKQTMWTAGKRMWERDTKYAIKAGLAIATLSAPAFFDSTHQTFAAYFGEWALISCFVVLSPTIGATNFLSLQRILCTLSGAVVAAGVYTLFPESPVILSIFGFFFSLPCFYFALTYPRYAVASRFFLLTYNLTCLYSYNLRQDDVSVVDIAMHRALAVIVGVLWATFVSRFLWPAEARRELSKALGEFCLKIGWLYTRLVASNSFAPEYREDGRDLDCDSDEVRLLGTPTLSETRLNNSIQEFMAMELHLQIKLIDLQKLLAEAQLEPRLKGPFPVQLYRKILTSLQIILDRLHSMRCVTTREEWYTNVRQNFIVPVNKERREMVGNIILSFSILSSAFRLKVPLPPYLPPAEKSRQRLVNAIRSLDIVKKRDIKGSRQLLFFAYALTMKGVTEELESLGRTLQSAFGVIGQSPEEFEALFVDPDNGRPLSDAA